jgi:hypothetical protein
MKHISTKKAKRIAISDMKKELKRIYVDYKFVINNNSFYTLSEPNKLINY